MKVKANVNATGEYQVYSNGFKCTYETASYHANT
jgi:hypothetical protein